MALPFLIPALQAGATMLQYQGTREYNQSLEDDAKAEAADALFTAEQLEANAKAIQAQGSRAAYFRRRDADIMESDAKAAMAAGGGGVDTQGLADINTAGDYNVVAELFDSERRASGVKKQAEAKRVEARLAEQRARRKKRSGLGSVLSGAASVFSSMPASK